MNRLKALQQRLDSWNIDALVIENPIDLLYLTNLVLSKGRLVIEKAHAQLYVDGRYIESASQGSPCPVSLLAKGKGLEAKRIGFDSSWTSVAALEMLQKEGPQALFFPIKKPLRSSRMIKSSSEIAALRKAAEVTMRGIAHLQDHCLKEGVSEEELAFEFEFFVRKHGASALAFEPIIAFGENSAQPHHRASKDRLKKNQAILVDVGAVVDRYNGDATRMFFFGKPPEEMRQMYALAQKAYAAAKDAARVGVAFGRLDRLTRDIFAENCAGEFFANTLGHGIGLEVHEPPLIKFDGDDRDVCMEGGMVFAIEPGIYLPGIGGARYENTGVLTAKGFEAFCL